MRYQHFFIFWPWTTNPCTKVYQNMTWPANHADLPSCHISSRCVNPRRRYLLPKNLLTNKQWKKQQAVNDMSTACQSACGD